MPLCAVLVESELRLQAFNPLKEDSDSAVVERFNELKTRVPGSLAILSGLSRLSRGGDGAVLSLVLPSVQPVLP